VNLVLKHLVIRSQPLWAIEENTNTIIKLPKFPISTPDKIKTATEGTRPPMIFLRNTTGKSLCTVIIKANENDVIPEIKRTTQVWKGGNPILMKSLRKITCGLHNNPPILVIKKYDWTNKYLKDNSNGRKKINTHDKASKENRIEITLLHPPNARSKMP